MSTCSALSSIGDASAADCKQLYQQIAVGEFIRERAKGFDFCFFTSRQKTLDSNTHCDLSIHPRPAIILQLLMRLQFHVCELRKRSDRKTGVKGIETSHFDETLVAAFERVSMTFPSRIALGSDVWQPTYRELNETANRLAHRLIACGAAMGDRAAILMSHDAQMVAAVLGILKASNTEPNEVQWQKNVLLKPDNLYVLLYMLFANVKMGHQTITWK